jgi:T5SS/PEP-CTERM-associated repeat protein
MRRKQISILLTALGVITAAGPAPATDRTWDGGAGTHEWFTLQNWDPETGTLLSSDDLTVDNGHQTSTTTHVYSNGGGSITIDGYDTSSTFPNLTIGDDGSGTLTLDGDPSVTVGDTLLIGDHGHVNLSAGLLVADTIERESDGTYSFTGGTVRVNTLTGFGDSISFGDLEIGHSGGSGSGSHTVGEGQSLTASGAYITVGHDAAGTLTAQGGAQITCSYITIAEELAGGATSTVTVSGKDPGTGTASALITSPADLSCIGSAGKGSLTVDGGASVSFGGDWTYIGCGETGEGTVLVTGPDSSWTSSAVEVGSGGKGYLQVKSGAACDCDWLDIGVDDTATGEVVVDGTQEGQASSLSCTPYGLTIGASGNGTLTVSNGGTMTSDSSHALSEPSIGLGFGSQGTATVQGADSLWTNTGDLYVGGGPEGSGGTGTLTVSSGGTVSVTGNVTVWAGGTASINGGTLTTTLLKLSGGTLAGDGTSTFASPLEITSSGATADVADEGELTLSGAVTWNGKLTKVDTGALVFDADTDLTAGALDIKKGTVEMSPAAGKTVTFTDRLYWGSTNGQETWTGTLAKTGAGRMEFSLGESTTVNVQSGTLEVEAGVVSVGGATDPFTDTQTPTSHVGVDNDSAGGATEGGLHIAAGAKTIDQLTGTGKTSVADGATLEIAEHEYDWDCGNAQDSLDLNSTGTLDLANNKIEIASDSETELLDLVKAAYNGGAWDEPGITSSLAGGDYGVGVHDVSGGVEVAYTLLGDANLDGTVGLADWNILFNNFGKTNATWDEADFNYDGTVSLADFNVLNNNFGKSLDFR